MSCRNSLGNGMPEIQNCFLHAPAQKLFDLVKVEKSCGDNPPRSFADYDVSVGKAPEGVELIEML